MSLPTAQVSTFPIADDRMITVHEAAVRAGVSVSTLKRCNSRGELKILKLSPRRLGESV